MATGEQFYTVNEAADILRVSRKTVYDWMKAGRLPYVQAGLRKRLIPREALDQFKRTWGVGLSGTIEGIRMPSHVAGELVPA